VNIPPAGSEAFVAVAGADRTAFTQLVKRALSGQLVVAADLSRLRYKTHLHVAVDAAGRPDLAVWTEETSGFRGQGTYVFAASPTRNVVLEVPHPITDGGTLEEGVFLMQRLGARALFIAGTERCADRELSPCGRHEPTRACDDLIRMSDAAHFTDDLFQAAHAAAAALESAPITVSLHTHVEVLGEPLIMISDGTRRPAAQASLTGRMRAALWEHGLQTASCNWPADGTLRLCGDGNVQGRLSNGAVDACLDEPVASLEHFLYIEQVLSLADVPDTLLGALEAVMPAIELARRH
jgi:hypothetical protein